jgi:hypothetical protein
MNLQGKITTQAPHFSSETQELTKVFGVGPAPSVVYFGEEKPYSSFRLPKN